MTSKQEKLLKEAKKASLLVGVSGLISKVLAAIYRIPYQNLVGNRGFYAYQQLYPFLAIIMTLSLTGFPNLISSLVQEKSSRQMADFVKFSMLICWGSALLFLVNHQVLADLMGASQLAPAFFWLAGTLIITPFLSFYRGFDQGKGKMTLTAISQVLEQVIRVVIILVVAGLSLFYGWDIYHTAVLAASGNFFASLLALFYLIVRSKQASLLIYFQKGWSFSSLWSLALPSLVFTVYALYLLLFQLIDAFFVKNALVSSGVENSAAEALKGIYDRGQPLIQFGLVIIIALFTSYLPKLTKLYLTDKRLYLQESQDFLEFIFYLSLTLTVGFLAVLPLVDFVLFTDQQGLPSLSIYIVLIFLAGMVQFFHHHCFIIGQHYKSLLYLSFGLVLKLLTTGFLTSYLGIVGSSLSTVISLLLVLLTYLSTFKMVWSRLLNIKYGLALLVMVTVISLIKNLLPQETRAFALLNLMVSVMVGGAIFILCSYRGKIFSDRLWSFLPIFNKK